MVKTETRKLYIIKARRMEGHPRRPLTEEEKLAGWRDGESRSGEPRIVNEWHELGLSHDLRAPHFLAWELKPGEEVVAALKLTITCRFTETGSDTISIRCVPECWSAHTISYRARAIITTVLGRPVILGEDGAEDAFGNDALTPFLENALHWRIGSSETRPQMCQLTLIPEPDDEEEAKKWEVELEKSTVKVTNKEIDL